MIKLVKSTFYNETKTKKLLLDFISRAKILSMDGECRKFEEKFAKKQQRKYAVFVSSGSAANLVLFQSLLNIGRLKKGDVVGVSALTWPTNIMPVIQLGLVPFPLDCELSTLNTSPDILSKYIKNLRCLFITNVLGFSDRIEQIQELCKKNNILFIEDNCESLGSKVKNKLLGNFGAAATFSFFVGHHLSTIEGGMICTDDEELYEMTVMVRAHGWDRNLLPAKQKAIRFEYNIDNFLAKYTFYDLAYNARPTEINGYLGDIQLKYWDEIVTKRQNNFFKFHQLVKKNNEFIPFKLDHMSLISNFAMPIICRDEKTFNKYKSKFEKNDIEIRPVIAGDMTQQPFYRKCISSQQKCPNASFIHKCGFYFGNNPELTEEEINLIVKLLKK